MRDISHWSEWFEIMRPYVKNPPMKMESMRTVRLQKKRILYIEVILPESIEKIDESAKKRNERELYTIDTRTAPYCIILPSFCIGRNPSQTEIYCTSTAFGNLHNDNRMIYWELSGWFSVTTLPPTAWYRIHSEPLLVYSSPRLTLRNTEAMQIGSFRSHNIRGASSPHSWMHRK